MNVEKDATDARSGPAAPALSDLLFCGTHGWVVAVHKFTGSEVWRTSLPRTGWSIVTLLFEEGVLFAATGGRVFALNPLTGEIAWKNELGGLGGGHLCLATILQAPNAGAAPIPQIVQSDDDARQHHSGGSTG